MIDFTQWLNENKESDGWEYTHFGQLNATANKVIIYGQKDGTRRAPMGLERVNAKGVAKMIAGMLGIKYPRALEPRVGHDSVDWLSAPLSKTDVVSQAAKILMDYADAEAKKKLAGLGGDMEIYEALKDVHKRHREKMADSVDRENVTHYFVNGRDQVVLLGPRGAKDATKDAIAFSKTHGANPPSFGMVKKAITGVNGFNHPSLEPVTNFVAASNVAPKKLVKRILNGGIKYLPGYGRELDPNEVHERMKD